METAGLMMNGMSRAVSLGKVLTRMPLDIPSHVRINTSQGRQLVRIYSSSTMKLLLLSLCGLTEALSFSNTILVLARDALSAQRAASGLEGYGIPYESVIVPATGTTLPQLNRTADEGNYGGFIVMGEVSYPYTTGWRSALTPFQWQELYDYQAAFRARMVRIDVYPTPEFG